MQREKAYTPQVDGGGGSEALITIIIILHKGCVLAHIRTDVMVLLPLQCFSELLHNKCILLRSYPGFFPDTLRN